MKYLKLFENFGDRKTIYEIDWHTIAPDEIVVIKGGLTDINGYILDERGNPTKNLMKYKLGNIMANQVHQVTYDRDFDFFGIPDTLEIDVSVMSKDGVEFELPINISNKVKSFGSFDELEEVTEENKPFMNIEITFGDLVAVGFDIYPDGVPQSDSGSEGKKEIKDDEKFVDVYQFTSYHSKFDPSNTVFAFDESSLNKFVKFINCFTNFEKITRKDFNFLDNVDNFKMGD